MSPLSYAMFILADAAIFAAYYMVIFKPVVVTTITENFGTVLQAMSVIGG